jgi:hypothetical protein
VLFERRFHAGLQDGSIRLSFRAWARPQVKVGGRYRTGAGMLEVDDVTVVTLAELRDTDARRSGFADLAELSALLRRSSSRTLRANSRIYRVEFHFAGQITSADLPPAEEALSPDEIEALTARLAKMDRLSRRGPWTRQVLDLIEKQPRTAASKLAPELERETLSFKADVRKLKKLGLTVSFEVGYAISPRGRVYLKATRRRA